MGKVIKDVGEETAKIVANNALACMLYQEEEPQSEREIFVESEDV